MIDTHRVPTGGLRRFADGVEKLGVGLAFPEAHRRLRNELDAPEILDVHVAFIAGPGLFNALYMKRSEHKASRPPRVMR
jgi:hypothetical protein